MYHLHVLYGIIGVLALAVVLLWRELLKREDEIDAIRQTPEYLARAKKQ